MSGLLEKLAYKLIPDTEQVEKVSELDDRLLVTPAIALDCAYKLTCDMAEIATKALKSSLKCLSVYDKTKADFVREIEDKTDHLEDVIGTYLIKLSTKQLNENEGATLTPALLNELIEKIEVHSIEGKGKNKTQRIVIHYCFIGVIENPVKDGNIVLEARQGVVIEYFTA